MATKNDEKIIALKDQIAKKRENLAKKPTFSPITNCNIELFGTRCNLHAANRENLVLMMCTLQSLQTTAESNHMEDYLVISGYPAKDWISDIKSRLRVMQYNEDAKVLNQLERRLDSMLSDDKKTELELDSIAELLK